MNRRDCPPLLIVQLAAGHRGEEFRVVEKQLDQFLFAPLVERHGIGVGTEAPNPS